MLTICLNIAKYLTISCVLNGMECLFFIATQKKPEDLIILQCMKWNELTQIHFRLDIKLIKTGEQIQ